jgi:hypothetical protein
LSVTFEGVNGSGNNEWLVAAAPDPAFFTDTTSGFGSSLAVELAFQVEGSTIVGVTENDSNWPFDNPGDNPFTNSVTFGTWLSDLPVDLAFGAFGGNVFLSGDLVPILTMETLGSGPTTILYGAAASGDDVQGATIAQTGQNFPVESVVSELAGIPQGGAPGGAERHFFTGYSGMVSSVPEPSAIALTIAALAVAYAVRSRH